MLKKFMILMFTCLILCSCSSNNKVDNKVSDTMQEDFNRDYDFTDVFNYTLDMSLQYNQSGANVIINVMDRNNLHLVYDADNGKTELYLRDGIQYLKNGDNFISSKSDLSIDNLDILFSAKINQKSSVLNGYKGKLDDKNLLKLINDNLGLSLESLNASYSNSDDITYVYLTSDNFTLNINIKDINKTNYDVDLEESESNVTLAMYCYNVKKVNKSFLKKHFRNYNIKEPSSKCYKILLDILNNKTSVEFLDSLADYTNWSKTKKQALAYLVKLDIFDVNSLLEYGVNIEELVKIVNKL